MNKMIKLSEEHYIIVDDSEIKEGDWSYFPFNKEISIASEEKGIHPDSKRITHSTQPLNKDFNDWFDVQIITLSEIQELIYGYSVEKMAEKWLSLNYGDVLCGYAMMDGYMEGFKAHKELVKDKLFTNIWYMFYVFIKHFNAPWCWFFCSKCFKFTF